MFKITKSQLDKLFNTPSDILPYETIASQWTEEFGITVNAKDVQEVFRANGYNLRTRAQKAGFVNLLIVVDDTNEVNTNEAVNETELVEEFNSNGIYQ